MFNKKSYPIRFLFCILSLTFHSVGNLLGIKADVAGTNAWTTLSLGFTEKFDFIFGVWTFVIKIIIIVIDLIGKSKLGFVTVLNIVLIPIITDILVDMFCIIPNASTHLIGAVKFFIELAVMIIGVILSASFGLGTVLVMVMQASLLQLACKITHYEP